MRAFRKLRRRIRALLAKESLDRDMSEEMRLHLELESEELARTGLSREEAARRARLAFGGVEQHKESARDGRGVRAINSLVRDLGYVVRSLGRAPAFTLAVVFSLALGIGANSTMFTILHAVLLRPLPYANPGELLAVPTLMRGVVQPVVLEPSFRAWSSGSRTLASVAWYAGTDVTVAGGALPERVSGAAVTANIFSLLGAVQQRGRLLLASDEDSAAAPVVLLSDGLWRKHFAADSAIVGKVIQLSDRPWTVVGVLRPGQEFPPRRQFWIPWKSSSTRTKFFFGEVVARSRPDVHIEQVERELTQISVRVDSSLPPVDRGMTPVVRTLHDELYGSSKTALTILFVAVLLLMLIACANVANLVLARTLNRQREFAVRVTLGAGQGALVWLVLAESLVLALAGAATGMLLSLWATRVFVGLSPSSISRVPNITLNAQVFAYTAALATAAALMIGIVPALRASRRDPRASLGEGGAREGTGRIATRMRRALVAGQLAIAVVLLAGAGLLIRSLDRLSKVDLEFVPDHVLTMAIALPNARYSGGRAGDFFDQLSARLRTLPGVRDVAYGEPPLRGFTNARSISGDSPFAGILFAEAVVGPRYFETFGIPIRAGRGFGESDDSASVPVAILNEAASRVFFPGGNAVGQELAPPALGKRKPVVVGVVADFPQHDVAEHVMPEVFYASAQVNNHPYTISMRATGDAAAMSALMRSAVHDLDPALAISAIQTMDGIVASSIAPFRFASLLLGAFAGLALVLAALGLYGVIAYGVARRSRELGIRAALGATSRGLMLLVAGEMVWVIALGLAAGLTGAWLLSHVMQNLLYGTGVHDPLTFVLVPLALLVTASIATIIPARKAQRVNPIDVLQAE
jgi:predicted permease